MLKENKRKEQCVAHWENSTTHKRRVSEYNKLKEYLLEEGILYEEITHETIIKYLMKRSFCGKQEWMTLESLKMVLARLKIILEDLGYTKNPANHRRVNEALEGYKIINLRLGWSENKK